MKKFACLITLLLCLLPLSARSQQPGYSTYLGSGAFPLTNPFFIALNPFTGVVTTTSAGYTLANGTGACTLGAGTKKIILVLGQSLGLNYAQITYSVTNPTKNFTLNPFDGLCYQTQGALVGTQTNGSAGGFSSYLAKTADNLITNSEAPGGVIIIPVMYGGTVVAQWTQGSAGSFPHLWNNINVIARRLLAISLTPTDIVWEQGTNDGIAGTSQASYSASLAIVIALLKINWPTVPILINTESWNGSAVNSGIQAAQAAAIDNTTTFVGCNTDAFGNADRYDTLHWNSTGYPLVASCLETAVAAH